ncbi:WXG100 family type VII secretion target [Kitasatospora aureofaciens]|uniref:WXG100 family type VII secretion target n=1 Tax=Kitasatospora aureofaciens TaxID=1894 RepID=UPI001C4425F1|nr:WXG100 family type VII secretion target [Kitasatospora aureofaciens]MBV6698698.1 WXG100 family type VII secretion target [Kitasatospora aureofaciens]
MSDVTNFEKYDHAQLRDMVRTTDATKVLSRGTQLKAAGQVLNDLSAALKSHVEKVGWEGPAAESFKTWAGNLQKSAALLGDYSSKAGDAMNQAGEALSTAQVAVSEPPRAEITTLATAKSQLQYLPSNVGSQLAPRQSLDDFMQKSRGDGWITQARAEMAAATIERERQEAIRQMEKLAQAYSAASTTLNSLEEPNLPGTPGAPDRISSADYSAGGGRTAGSGGAIRTSHGSPGSAGGSYSPGGGSYSRGSVALHQSALGPEGPDTPSRTDPISSHGGGYVPLPEEQSASTPLLVPSPPIDRPGTGLDSLPTVPTLPSQSGPVGPGGGNLPFDGLGGVPGYPGGPGEGGGNPGFPGGGPVPVGGFLGKGGSVPARNGGTIPGKGGGSIPGRTGGPFGGGSLPGKTGTPGLPTGTVFGAREAQPGRAGASGMPGMGGMNPGMGGHGVGGSGGGTRGRGLASTSGGTVGGRKGPAAGGEFTPGGTGLRKRAGAVEGAARSGQNGMPAPGTLGGGAGRNERDRRQRADYLHEDEETWTSGTPHSNPNVVE